MRKIRMDAIVLCLAILFIAMALILSNNESESIAKDDVASMQQMMTEISRKETKEEVISVIREYGFSVDESHTVEQMVLSVYSQLGYDLQIFTQRR